MLFAMAIRSSLDSGFFSSNRPKGLNLPVMVKANNRQIAVQFNKNITVTERAECPTYVHYSIRVGRYLLLGICRKEPVPSADAEKMAAVWRREC